MRISRTPLRISFCGGGTDYPQWFNYFDGAILGVSIDKYCYVMLHDGKCWHTFDLPTKSGLASSSAYTVGLLRVSTELDKQTIAKLATVWEQDKMNGNVGSQDQYLCSVGGFHLLRFNEHGIRDKAVPLESVVPLQDWLLLFDTHRYRLGSFSIEHQLANLRANKVILEEMARMPDKGLLLLQSGDYIGFGKMLNEAWKIKRALSDDVSTPEIDAIYDLAIKAGAIGGKLLGGGGGGFIIFLAEPEKHETIKSALENLTYTPFGFEQGGTQIIYDSNCEPK